MSTRTHQIPGNVGPPKLPRSPWGARLISVVPLDVDRVNERGNGSVMAIDPRALDPPVVDPPADSDKKFLHVHSSLSGPVQDVY